LWWLSWVAVLDGCTERRLSASLWGWLVFAIGVAVEGKRQRTPQQSRPSTRRRHHGGVGLCRTPTRLLMVCSWGDCAVSVWGLLQVAASEPSTFSMPERRPTLICFWAYTAFCTGVSLRRDAGPTFHCYV
jgi:hypothetical protein